MAVKNTSYQSNGKWFDTYKFKKNGEVKILVKSEGKANHVVRFEAITGRILKPSEDKIWL
jgi:hypothetical protein